jgi:hypothetical protein
MSLVKRFLWRTHSLTNYRNGAEDRRCQIDITSEIAGARVLPGSLAFVNIRQAVFLWENHLCDRVLGRTYSSTLAMSTRIHNHNHDCELKINGNFC